VGTPVESGGQITRPPRISSEGGGESIRRERAHRTNRRGAAATGRARRRRAQDEAPAARGRAAAAAEGRASAGGGGGRGGDEGGGSRHWRAPLRGVCGVAPQPPLRWLTQCSAVLLPQPPLIRMFGRGEREGLRGTRRRKAGSPLASRPDRRRPRL
jgi:hypothetical protein